MPKSTERKEELGLGIKPFCQNCQRYLKKEISYNDKVFISDRIKERLSLRERIYKFFNK